MFSGLHGLGIIQLRRFLVEDSGTETRHWTPFTREATAFIQLAEAPATAEVNGLGFRFRV